MKVIVLCCSLIACSAVAFDRADAIRDFEECPEVQREIENLGLAKLKLDDKQEFSDAAYMGFVSGVAGKIHTYLVSTTFSYSPKDSGNYLSKSVIATLKYYGDPESPKKKLCAITSLKPRAVAPAAAP